MRSIVGMSESACPAAETLSARHSIHPKHRPGRVAHRERRKEENRRHDERARESETYMDHAPNEGRRLSAGLRKFMCWESSPRRSERQAPKQDEGTPRSLQRLPAK